MDIRKIKKLIELIDETGVAEIEIHEGEESVRICRSNKQATYVHYPEQPSPAPLQSSTSFAPPAPVSNQVADVQSTVQETQASSSSHVITAPMVGTVYFAPSPDSDPFITLGQDIAAGDVVCVIEAMKMFNEIETDISGVVREVHVENAQPVEFGQPLFTLDIDQ